MVDTNSRQVRLVPLFYRRFSNGPVPSPPPPRPITLSSRPILFVSIFVVLHQSVATLALLPAYGYFHLTDSSTAFLVGPNVTSLLRKPLPFSRDGRTVEDVLDNVVGFNIKVGWGFWNVWKGRKSDEGEGDEVVKEVLEQLEEKTHGIDATQDLQNRLVEMKNRAIVLKNELQEERLRNETIQNLKDRLAEMKEHAIVLKDKLQGERFWSQTKQDLNNRVMEIKDHAVNIEPGKVITKSVDKLREWKNHGIESLPEFDEVVPRKSGALKAMTDAAAAYIVVKASAPLRLALNIFLTPKLARVFVRRWG